MWCSRGTIVNLQSNTIQKHSRNILHPLKRLVPRAGSGEYCTLDSSVDFDAIYILFAWLPPLPFFFTYFSLLIYFLMGGWWKCALVSPDGVAPSQMVNVSVNLPLHHHVQKFSSGTGSPRWSQKRAVKSWWWWWCGIYFLSLFLRE